MDYETKRKERKRESNRRSYLERRDGLKKARKHTVLTERQTNDQQRYKKNRTIDKAKNEMRHVFDAIVPVPETWKMSKTVVDEDGRFGAKIVMTITNFGRTSNSVEGLLTGSRRKAAEPITQERIETTFKDLTTDDNTMLLN